jgi:hypothetical protein
MLRFQDSLRLTEKERQTFQVATGVPVNPTSVELHNRIVRQAQAHFADVVDTIPADINEAGEDQSGVAESRLMAAVLGNMLLQE